MSDTNTFATSLLKKLGGRNENIFFSPYSIASAFSLVEYGAVGETSREMLSVLPAVNEYDGIDRVPVINVANGVWLHRGMAVKPDYQHSVERVSADVGLVDFVNDTEDARKIVNAWVYKKTQSKISDLFPSGSLNELTRLVIANAIYFKDSWRKAFSKGRTRPDSFVTSSSKVVTVSMMWAKEQHTRYWDTNSFSVVILPYRDPKLDMVIILPKTESVRIDVERFLDGVLGDVEHNCRYTELDMYIPRFRMETNYNLIPPMQQLGIRKVFTDDSDLSGISPDEPLLKVGAAFHKAFVVVDEEGTEAAAATGLGLMKCCSVRTPQQFRVDHPFLFTIRYEGAPVFIGRVVDPS